MAEMQVVDQAVKGIKATENIIIMAIVIMVMEKEGEEDRFERYGIRKEVEKPLFLHGYFPDSEQMKKPF